MKRYNIVHADSYEGFIRIVQEFMETGWDVSGSPLLIDGMWYQAMTFNLCPI